MSAAGEGSTNEEEQRHSRLIQQDPSGTDRNGACIEIKLDPVSGTPVTGSQPRN